jgi:hypothetical protein
MKKTSKTPIACALFAVSIMSSGQAAIVGFTEDFTSKLDAAWNESGDTGTHDATNDLYSITHSNGDASPKLSRSEGGSIDDYTHTITINLVDFLDPNVGADLKWKTFGADGFTEIIFNSFGNVRMFHDDFSAGAGNLFTNVPIAVTDGQTLSFKQEFTLATNSMSVTYSVNGGADQPLFSGTSNIGGSFDDVITNFAESELFEFNGDLPVPVIEIQEWNLTAGVVPEPSTAVLLAGFFALAAVRRRR